jgi:signal transduction histidine kinase
LTRWLHARAARRLSDKGALLGFVGTVEDISERKRTEEALVEANRELGATLEQLRETQRQIIQTERLRALGQMASGIAHDINNSLACILGFSDLLLSHPKNLDDKRKLAEFLMFINIAARDAGNVVHRLREFYRKRDDHGQLSSVNLNQIARDAVALSEPRWKTQAQSDGINVQIQIDLGDIPEIIGQPTELRETLMNLIFNAVDALIFARRDGVITLHTRTADAGVLVEVSDDGDGMADEVRAHCLEPFFTTKGERGTGLGMATVYGVVQRHQGNIDIRSAPDQGTAVTIWLPLPPPAQPQQAAPRSAEGRPSRSLRVLLVEDEATIQEMMAACLMEDGHEVELAGDGVAALEKFQEGRFDVVITDHAMPRMNGADMAAVIRKQSPRQPIVFLTGFGDMINDVTRQPVPTKHIIGKPVSIKVLREVLVRATSEEA